MRNHKSGLTSVFIFTIFGLTLFESSAFSAGWVQATARSSGATLRRQPSAQSEVLGKYPAGSSLKVYSEPRDGFYSMYFQQEYKGTHYVWISADELDIRSSAGGSSFSSSRSSGKSNSKQGQNRLRVGANYAFYSPSEFQVGIGDTASSVGGLGFHLDYERRISKLFAAMVGFDTYTFTQATSATVPGGTYFSTGYAGMLGFTVYILNNGNFTLSATAAGGVSISSSGNTTTTTQITTSSILGFPILATVNVDYRLYNKSPAIFGNFWVFLKLGYQIQSLSAIPVFAMTSATQTTANLSLNAPIGTLGVQLEF